jgi:hypothetical protein
MKEKYLIWDYDKESEIELTDEDMRKARDEPDAFPGCIERGKDLVVKILTNRV